MKKKIIQKKNNIIIANARNIMNNNNKNNEDRVEIFSDIFSFQQSQHNVRDSTSGRMENIQNHFNSHNPARSPIQTSSISGAEPRQSATQHRYILINARCLVQSSIAV